MTIGQLKPKNTRPIIEIATIGDLTLGFEVKSSSHQVLLNETCVPSHERSNFALICQTENFLSYTT